MEQLPASKYKTRKEFASRETLALNLTVKGDYAAARSKSRSEGAIRATVTRTPSASSLLSARRAEFPTFTHASTVSSRLRRGTARRVDVPEADRGVRACRIWPLARQLSPSLGPAGSLPPTSRWTAQPANCIDHSPSTKANRVKFPAGPLPDFRKWESCRTMPGFLGDLLLPTSLHSGAAPYLPRFTIIDSQDFDVKSRPNLFTNSLTLTYPALCLSLKEKRDASSLTDDGVHPDRQLGPQHDGVLAAGTRERKKTRLNIGRGHSIPAPLRRGQKVSTLAIWPARDHLAEPHAHRRLSWKHTPNNRLVTSRRSPQAVTITRDVMRIPRCPEKARRQAASSSTIPTCENPGAEPPGIEPGSSWWEASALAIASPRHRCPLRGLKSAHFTVNSLHLNEMRLPKQKSGSAYLERCHGYSQPDVS
ncbi:hypothetical protein PR048_021912 [Dryococelus australis]|uniref:Uncharacterized protein n=1 Tax=Dryococelus australis TaxID=614101 RepID=A0ABQ9GZI8_9NEOP|nr:hypothetical protein PR048_021912 [Dryococelus australis]